MIPYPTALFNQDTMYYAPTFGGGQDLYILIMAPGSEKVLAVNDSRNPGKMVLRNWPICSPFTPSPHPDVTLSTPGSTSWIQFGCSSSAVFDGVAYWDLYDAGGTTIVASGSFEIRLEAEL